jgi:non-specific serine/threonine protein kinase
LGRTLVGDDASDLDLGFWQANLGRVDARAGALDAAERELELALVHFASAPGWYRAHVLVQLAGIARRRRELVRAGALLHEALGELRAAGAAVEAIGCLDELARVALDRGDRSTAASLFAAAARLRDETGLAMGDGDRQSLARDVERTRAGLTTSDFAAAWSRGRALTLDQAAALAVAPSESPPPRGGLADRPVAALTPREREVAALVAEGLSNSAIGQRLGIAQGTARIHVERILGKLGLTSRVQIATWAVLNPGALRGS